MTAAPIVFLVHVDNTLLDNVSARCNHEVTR